MIHLILNPYSDPDSARNRELQEAYTRNRQLAAEGRLVLHTLPGWATMDLFLNTTREICGPEDVWVFCNFDCFLVDPHQFNRVPNGHVWALTRYDLRPDGRLELFAKDANGRMRRDSQDCWAARGPARQVAAPFRIGSHGCDNAVAHAFQAAGYVVSNPCLTVKVGHIHNSPVRKRMEYCPKPYLLLDQVSL